MHPSFANLGGLLPRHTRCPKPVRAHGPGS